MHISSAIEGDTIAAVATAPGRGGVGIVRISGPQSLEIAQTVCAIEFKPRYAHYSEFADVDGNVLDSGIAIFFSSPHSFTGEDVVELQAHGGPVILDLILKTCCKLGARLARPGEFSERAYLNDKIDLSQAEAIADLINSSTAQAALNATRSLQGAFSTKIEALVQGLIELRVYVEAAIDFPEEEIDFLGDGVVAEKLQDIITQLNKVEQEARQGTLVRDGMKLVITGKPNAGKSSLLNAMAGNDRAIVTAIEGTTRDVLHEHIQIDGLPIHIVDTAGIRDSGDEIELEGIRRARQEIESADRVLLVIDSSGDRNDAQALLKQWDTELAQHDKQTPISIIYNKCDLVGRDPCIESLNHHTAIHLCAKSGEGLDLLYTHLKSAIGYQEHGEGQFSARRRHLDAIADAALHLGNGKLQLETASAGELLAEDLRQCQQALSTITGTLSSDDLLGEIFSSFCIGK